MKKILYAIGLTFYVLGTVAQTELTDLETLAERLFQTQQEDVNYEDLYENLLTFYMRPLNLNDATDGELAMLYILTPAQIRNLHDHIKTNGKLLSLLELQSVDGFDEATIRTLKPFVQVKNTSRSTIPLLKRILKEKNNQLFIRYSSRLEQVDGQAKNQFLGDPSHLFVRYRVARRNDFSLGFTAEKDPGEKWWSKTASGPDYLSYHFQLRDRGLLKNLIVGDFQYQAGQGLVYGAGFSPGKGAETILSAMKSSIGATPYTSATENGFFRGSSVTVGLGPVNISCFASSRSVDARLDRSENMDIITSLPLSGYHRTASEYSTLNAAKKIATGGHINYNVDRNFQIGATALYQRFSHDVKRPERAYNFYEFQGKENYVGSIYYRSYIRNLTLFGEIAASRSRDLAIVNGILISLHPSLQMSLVHRDYGKNFHSFYGAGFGENSRTINEKGIYWGLKFNPSKQHLLTLYMDIFKFPWLKFRVLAPSSGQELLFRYTFQPSKNMSAFIQYRTEKKQITQSIGKELKLTDQVKQNIVLNLAREASSQLEVRTRLQGSLSTGGQHGIALIQDITYKLDKVQLSARGALFQTTNFINRQYTYERDVLYAFSIPAYYGSGMRYFLLARYKYRSGLDLWIKIGQYIHPGANEVGSGLNRINGQKSTSIRIQIRKKFN